MDLDEPLSIEELQTGAFVLRVSRNGAPAVDAVGVPVLRSGGELDRIDIYAYGVVIGTASASGEGLLLGHYVVQLTDHSAEWQAVGVRLDREYWHGGEIGDTMIPLNSDGQYARVGNSAIMRTGGVFATENMYLLEIAQNKMLGGNVISDGKTEIYSGSEPIEKGDPGMMFNHASFSLDYDKIKAIPYVKGGIWCIKPLYPFYDPAEDFAYRLEDNEGNPIPVTDTPPPPYILPEY